MAMIEGKAIPIAPTMPPPNATQLVAYMACHVDGENTRCGLRHNHNVHKFLLVHPFMVVYKLLFHTRNHGIAATQSKGTNLVAGNKKFPKHTVYFSVAYY